MALSRKRNRIDSGSRTGTTGTPRSSGGDGIYNRGWINENTGSSSGGMQLDPNNASYSDLIKLLSGQGDLQQLLASLGIRGMGNMSDVQQQDWNKQLLDQLLAVQLEQDKRQYNEGIRDEQRIYDTPTNQLARLMGAGISRDAAIQLLGGSGSGSGSMVTGDTPELAQGTSASQSNLNAIQGRTAIAQTVFGAIGSIAGAIGALGSFGMSAAAFSTNLEAARAAAAGQILGNKQLSATLQGIDNASQIINAVSSAVTAGVIPKDKQFDSAQDMVKFIQDHPDFAPFAALSDTGALDRAMHDVYSLDALNHGYESWRKTNDYNIDRSHLVRMQSLTELGARLDVDKARSEIMLNYQYYDESINRIINDNLRVENETKLADSTIALNDSVITLNNVTAQGVRYDNKRRKVDADFYEAGAADINDIRLAQINLEAAEWQSLMNDPEALKKEVTAWLTDRDNARTATALESIYINEEYDTQLDLHEPNPNGYQSLRDVALYWHNLFNFSLGNPKAGKDEAAALGKYAKSAAMMFLYKHP